MPEKIYPDRITAVFVGVKDQRRHLTPNELFSVWEKYRRHALVPALADRLTYERNYSWGFWPPEIRDRARLRAERSSTWAGKISTVLYAAAAHAQEQTELSVTCSEGEKPESLPKILNKLHRLVEVQITTGIQSMEYQKTMQAFSVACRNTQIKEE